MRKIIEFIFMFILGIFFGVAIEYTQLEPMTEKGSDNPVGGPYLFRKSDGWKLSDGMTGFIQVYKK